ncbi:uncharacterized protein si:ch211-250c4.3 isoform X1 [Conger conger]|uniref:uncharacterized protein si:ch211-250c4.3 isoform X1 n=2 Tax=Conger conger TaxID=82655 RepID=UPI002A5A2C2B|nr:uncharacterized protein si:ch211-250c4.3 isoform X1 [Conger conger]
MSLKKRRASVVFNWHKSFTILAPWRKGKGDMVLDSEVVLTKMKIFSNFHEKNSCSEDSVSTISISVSEQDASEPVRALDRDGVHSAPQPEPSDPKPDYLSVFSEPQLPRLFKFESEDSGVELPSGANSPSTPTGSEHSFVVHSRESSCDSRELNSSAPSPNALLLLERCPESEEAEDSPHRAEEEGHASDSEVGLSSESEPSDITLTQEVRDENGPEEGALGNAAGVRGSGAGLEAAGLEAAAEDSRQPMSCESRGAFDDMTEVDLQQQPLRKSTTSDSLDEYMDECCRLSEVHQAKSNPLGSGLGYLEHICQLIEKIGQLQEHNLRLQKQICCLQKEGRTRRTKEDFFLQHCCCGAASLAFQELKRHSRSEFYNLSASNATLSDLSTIPEITRQPLGTGTQEGENGCHPAVSLSRKGLNRRSYAEGEARYLCDSTEALSVPHRRLSENYTWGRVKELVKKTKLKNQSRLGLTSNSLKRSCPQLYRPDLGPVDLPKRDRNSMIALGHQNKADFSWPQ